MARCVCLFLLVAALLAMSSDRVRGDLVLDHGSPAASTRLFTPTPLASLSAPYLIALTRGPGGYLSIAKLVLLLVVFVIWVRTTDWINRDAVRLASRLDMKPEVWNPIVVGSFLVGFILAISVPIFVVGYPIYVVSALVPWAAYFFIRRSKISETPSVARALKAKPGEEVSIEVLPQDDGHEVNFSPAGSSEKQQQVNLIKARQSSGYLDFKELLYDSQFKRAEQIMLDYTRDRTSARILVDGVWHPLEPRDRESGDALLVSMKSMAGLNAAERRGKQQGRFSIKTELGKAGMELTTQGVKTGERVLLKLISKSKPVLTLAQIGMFPEMSEKLIPTLNGEGLGVVSTPAGTGLSTSWQSVLAAADRLTRDCVALIDGNDQESRVENIVIHEYDPDGSVKQFDVLKKLLLTQPDLIAVPEINDSPTMDLLTLQVVAENRSVLTRVRAKSAAEALIRVYVKAANRDQFANAVKFVTSQRLMRRLCDTCKQEVRVNPKIIQQLGGNPKKQKTLQNQWRLPPPEQRVDEKGRPIEFPPCETCGGLGYIGRIAIFELLEVNDSIRATLKSNPKTEAIEKAARESGKTTLPNQAYRLVLLGVTSLAEAQRVLKQGTQ